MRWSLGPELSPWCLQGLEANCKSGLLVRSLCDDEGTWNSLSVLWLAFNCNSVQNKALISNKEKAKVEKRCEKKPRKIEGKCLCVECLVSI